MTAQTITPAMIRRYPFAAPGHMITAQDEAFIAAHMRASVTAEQRGREPFMTRSTQSAQEAGAKACHSFRARKAAERRQAIIDILRGREMTVAQIADELAAQGHTQKYSALGNYIDAMRNQGLLEARPSMVGARKTNLWRVPPKALVQHFVEAGR